MKNEIDTTPPVVTPADRAGGISLVPVGQSAPSDLVRPSGAAPRVDPVTVFLTGYTSANSRRAMTSSLCAVASVLSGRDITDPRAVPWHEIRYEHASAAKAKMAATYASTTVNRHLTALRGIVKSCWRVGLIDREVYDRVADVPLMRASRPEAGRALSAEEMGNLFDACNVPPTTADVKVYARDAAILALTMGCGLRRSEVCELRFFI